MKGFPVFLYNSSTVLYQQPKGQPENAPIIFFCFCPSNFPFFTLAKKWLLWNLPTAIFCCIVAILTASHWLSREPRELPPSSTPYFPPWTQDCLPGYGGGGSWRLACNFSIQKHFLHFPISPGALFSWDCCRLSCLSTLDIKPKKDCHFHVSNLMTGSRPL